MNAKKIALIPFVALTFIICWAVYTAVYWVALPFAAAYYGCVKAQESARMALS